jgi:Ti-type conjugative transfer relaxase TraA
MPSNHIDVRNAGSTPAGKHYRYQGRLDHYAYLNRDGRYEERGDLSMSESGNLPVWAAHDAAIFWDAADQYERRNGRVYKEVVVAIPRQLDDEQRVALVREFVGNLLGERHAYSWAIHNPRAGDGREQPHAHIMFSARMIDGIARDPTQFFRRYNPAHPEKGGARKDPYLSSKRFVYDVREEWAMTANHFMSRYSIEARIEHRSYRTLGIELEPSAKVGIAWHAGERGVMADVLVENRARAQRNGERLMTDPGIAIQALTLNQSTFSRREIEQFVFRNTDSEEQFRLVLARLMNSKELRALRDTGREGDWFTTRELHAIETRLVERARAMSQTGQGAPVDAVLAGAIREVRGFNAGQAAAYEAIIAGGDLVVVNGAAGTGKSYVLAAAREVLQASGQRVIGAALQGKTADDMQRDAGIDSRTLHSLLAGIGQGTVTLDRQTVIVIDEAGMVGSRQMETLLGYAQARGARVRLVGDAWQLAAVDAGDAFRAVSKEAGTAGRRVSLTEIIRQKDAWQREASAALARHDVEAAVTAYGEHGHITPFQTVEQARHGLLMQWWTDRDAYPQASQLLLTHTNDQREALNALVRTIRRAMGELGPDHTVSGEGGPVAIAAGDRIMFLRNESVMGVKNGTLATVERIGSRAHDGAQRSGTERTGAVLHVRLDDGRQVAVDTGQYGHFSHGYALTVHKSQGVTVDRAYVLVTKRMQAELAYVAMTRHRVALTMTVGLDEFANVGELIRGLSRAEDKAFSARHEVVPEAERGRETGERHTVADRRNAVEFDAAPPREVGNEPSAAAPVPGPSDEAVAAAARLRQLLAQAPPATLLLHHQRDALRPALKAWAKAMDGVRGASLLAKLSSEQTRQAKAQAAEAQLEAACPGALAALDRALERDAKRGTREVRDVLDGPHREARLMRLVEQGLVEQGREWSDAIRDAQREVRAWERHEGRPRTREQFLGDLRERAGYSRDGKEAVSEQARAAQRERSSKGYGIGD